MKDEKKLQRRSFIKSAAIISGAAICGAVSAKKSIASQFTPEPVEAPRLPWGYQELDPEYVRKLGHLGYYLEECGGGAFWAIMTAIKEKIGSPYNHIPLPSKEEFLDKLAGKKTDKHLQVMMQYGVGGVMDYGTLCGAPNGSASAISIALSFDEAKPVITRLLRFYETASFPSNEANEYADKGEFYPPKYKSSKVLPQSASHSVLCHVSVGKWCEKAGYASGSKERSERCARVTGDVAAMAVTLLNAHMKGELNTVFPMKLSQETVGCRSCHYKGKNFEAGQFTRGFTECESCHGDMRPHLGENKLKTAYGADVGKWAGAAVVGTAVGIGAHAVTGRLGKKGENDEE